MTVSHPAGPSPERRAWLSVLAKAAPKDVFAAWEAIAEPPGYGTLRAPEIGMVLVRGRMGGGKESDWRNLQTGGVGGIDWNRNSHPRV